MLQKIRELPKHLAIYGAGDVAIQALNFLLLPFYVRYLSPADYGVLALLASVEATVKLFFRWGVDGAFMRFWYDCEDERGRQRLASTLVLFSPRHEWRAARAFAPRRTLPLRTAPAVGGLHAGAAARASEHLCDRVHLHPVSCAPDAETRA